MSRRHVFLHMRMLAPRGFCQSMNVGWHAFVSVYFFMCWQKAVDCPTCYHDVQGEAAHASCFCACDDRNKLQRKQHKPRQAVPHTATTN
jgi:hypothetical protein